MSGDERDVPLSDDLRALLDASRELDPLPPATAERLLHGIDRRVALGGGHAPARPGPWRRALSHRALLTVVSFALGALAGTAIERLRHPVVIPVQAPPRVVYVDRPAPPVAPVIPAPPVRPTAVVAPAVVADAGPPQRARGHEPDDDDDLASEQATLELARSSLRAGQPEAALEALHRHARRHPHGQLVPEREALTVRSLMALHREDEARRTAERFLRRYPDSSLRDSVEAALRGP